LYLSAQELIELAGVNPIFHTCIRRSPKAQAKLFLRRSSEPQQIWYRSLNRGQRGYKQTVELTRNTGPDGMGFGQWDEPLPMSRICPLLRPKDHGTPGKDTPRPGLAVIVARLNDLERFGDMMLTDPTIYSAGCTLWYKHTVRPTCWILGDRGMQSTSPLTVRGLLECTFRMPGSTMICHEDAGAGEANRLMSTKGSFEEAIAEQCSRLSLMYGFQVVCPPCARLESETNRVRLAYLPAPCLALPMPCHAMIGCTCAEAVTFARLTAPPTSHDEKMCLQRADVQKGMYQYSCKDEHEHDRGRWN
jgi:hypothetical protein